MPKFLNTQGLSEWMSRIIEETERELVIISPYLQLSNRIFQKLLDANDRGVEMIFIYREDKLNTFEKSKLLAIDNLNLMSHPNVHAKCMYNENFLLIGSMNLYEYSEKNNREMGVLFHRIDIPELGGSSYGNADDDVVFDEALEEIIEIKNGAEMERPSRETIEDRFELEILKNKLDKSQEYVKQLNDIFIHKKFIITEEEAFLCKSYIDKVDVLWNYRIEFILKQDEEKLSQCYKKHKNNIKNIEYNFSGFKFYWNAPEKMFLYEDSQHDLWKNLNSTKEAISLRKKGIDEVIEFVKSELLTGFNKIKVAPVATDLNYNPLALNSVDIEKLHLSFQEKYSEIKINSCSSYVYCNMLFPFGDVMFREGFEIRFINVANHDSIINILQGLSFENNHFSYKKKVITKANQSPYFIFEPQEVTDVQKLIYDYIFMAKTISEKTKNIKLKKMFY